MPDYDAKSIPVLDDVIENGDNKKRDFDLSIESPDDETKASNLDLFTSETIDLAAEGSDIETSSIDVEAATITDSILEYTINPAAEPQIGAIDNISDEEGYIHGQTAAGQDIYPWMDDGSKATHETIVEQQRSGVVGTSEAVCQDDVPLYSPEKAAEDEAEKFESALIDYTAVDEVEIPTINVPGIEQQEDDPPLEEKQQTLTTISLQSVTDDIVKQLMPELEQQLRLLLEQALKEKLPEDSKHSDIPSASNPDN